MPVHTMKADAKEETRLWKLMRVATQQCRLSPFTLPQERLLPYSVRFIIWCLHAVFVVFVSLEPHSNNCFSNSSLTQAVSGTKKKQSLWKTFMQSAQPVHPPKKISYTNTKQVVQWGMPSTIPHFHTFLTHPVHTCCSGSPSALCEIHQCRDVPALHGKVPEPWESGVFHHVRDVKTLLGSRSTD